ncbi:MAG: hypothetical protein O3A14_13240, partial [Cyanobacteria bacterium]|nr:hypothetical protein [Cyanobacteriota bacterium]
MAIYWAGEYCSVMTARSPIPTLPLGLRWLTGSVLVVGYCLLAAPPVFKWDRAYLPRRSSPRSEVNSSAQQQFETPQPFAGKPTVPGPDKTAAAQSQSPATSDANGTNPSDHKADNNSKTAPRAGAVEPNPDLPPSTAKGATPATPSPPHSQATAPSAPPSRPPSVTGLTTPRPPRPTHSPLPEAAVPTAPNSALLATPPLPSLAPPRLAEAPLPSAQSSDFLATAPPQVWVPTPGVLPDGGTGIAGAPPASGPPAVAFA